MTPDLTVFFPFRILLEVFWFSVLPFRYWSAPFSYTVAVLSKHIPYPLTQSIKLAAQIWDILNIPNIWHISLFKNIAHVPIKQHVVNTISCEDLIRSKYPSKYPFT